MLLVRHGESRWNLDNKFTGWVDVPLSEQGIKEALATAKKLAGLELDVAFTSRLERAQETLLLILADQKYTGVFSHEGEPEASRYEFEAASREIPIHADIALNERHYGTLQGKNKIDAAREYGEEQVLAWRRSFKARPPEGESLADVYERTIPYFETRILPEVHLNKNVIVAAHGNSLRALIKYIEGIFDHDIANLELKMAEPIIYKFENGELTRETGAYSFDRPILW